MTTSRIWLSATLLLALAACNGQNLPSTLPTSLPSNSPALIRPSGTPNSTPATGAVVPPNSVTAPSSGQGELKVVGADLFNKYAVEYRTGMKWVYSLKMPGFSLPNIPSGAGFPSIPGFSVTQIPDLSSIPGLNLGAGASTGASAGASNGDLGEMIMEVKAVAGDQVTVTTEFKFTQSLLASFNLFKPTQSTFSKSNRGKMYEGIGSSNGTNGTLTYSLVGSESVSVPAGSYTADKISSKLATTTAVGSGSAESSQDTLLWMASGVGLAKHESKTVIQGTTSSVLLELKSFTP
ncbi:MAG: hypothetical protein IV090_20910 [Candidatus Sericytochromatia bacterium]|nr:hypothetical protein [Candidatus Sericytochromatia bacterium]